jgi:predicted ArsR family transcriptional regulator
VYSLTAKGRAALSQGYDGLALDALRFVQRTQGDSGVYAFARERADRLMSARAIPAGDVAFAAPVIAEALTEAGYAAAVEAPSDRGPVVQICQHACPVIDAAIEFPALCDAETDALSAVLGRHVTRLATLAKGDGVCTTVIPTTVDSSRRAPA